MDAKQCQTDFVILLCFIQEIIVEIVGLSGTRLQKDFPGSRERYGWIGRKLQLIALDFSRDRFGKFIPKYYDARIFVGRRMMLYIILDFFL